MGNDIFVYKYFDVLDIYLS